MSNSKEQGSEKPPLQDSALAIDEQHVSLSTTKFTAIILSICSVSFFIGFDSTCVGTIAPIITDDFNSLGDIGWYGIAYLLASCSTILSWGKLYSFYPERGVFGISICIFVLGSILCAVAQSSPAFIVGRTIAGLGNGGALSGCSIVISRITPLARRPLYLGIVGGVECLALSLAPLLAGIIAKYSTWRICFYISIPFGVLSALVVFTMMDLAQTAQQSNTSVRQKLAQLDLPGMALFVPFVICLILALQWGGTVYPWSDSRVIVLLVFFGALAVAFAVEQYFANTKSTATVPVTILRSPTILLVVSYAFSTAAALNLYEYYVPLFYQAVQGLSTLGSGLRDLGRMIGLTISLLLVGAITSKIGFYNPAMILGTFLICIGTGLTITFRPHIPAVDAIVYQTILGVGSGFAFQQPVVAVQTILPQALIPSAIVLVSFAQSLGSIVSLAVAQNLFRSRLLQELTAKLPTIQPNVVLNTGVLDLKNIVPPGDLNTFLNIYSDALRSTYFAGLGFACASVIGAFCTPWNSMKAEPKKQEAQSAEEQSDAQNVNHEKNSSIEV